MAVAVPLESVHGLLLPQTTLKPAMVFDPQTTFEPHTTHERGVGRE